MSREYDKSIGYSSLNKIDNSKLIKKFHVVDNILKNNSPVSFCEGKEVLVAGCGNGEEAELLSKTFNSRIIGVDINVEEERSFKNLKILNGDITSLSFKDKEFDLVYSYHVLEHVQDPLKALMELERVLDDGGILFIGFPNRSRLIGYVGSHNKMTLWDKVRYNLNDYKYRLRGKFKNEYGAHAGFSQREFFQMAKGIFKEVIDVREEYFARKFESHKGKLKFLNSIRAQNLIYPSNYFICTK